MVKIAIDGMGGDYGPQVVVDGAVQAANQLEGVEIVIVGREDAIKRELNQHQVVGGKISVHHASEVIGMGESPVQAIRKKKDSSLAVCVDLLKRNEVAAIVSAGNTGAVVAASTLNLGLLPGIKRPGIAIALPTLHGISVAIDVGANIAPTPEHLLQYAIMVENYARFLLKKKRPSVALLNIGEEESKGTEVIQEAYRMLRDSGINFIGNVEGRDFFTGKCDCIVCDGFVGNVVLKMTESILDMMITLIKREMQKNFLAQIGALMCRSAFDSIRQETNYEEAGGALLLGVDGVVIISHGISSAKAIKNAVRVGRDAVVEKVNEHITEGIGEYLRNHANSSPSNSSAPKVNP
jgi:glycerol-3-phosphate acyltransferase PlsX